MKSVWVIDADGIESIEEGLNNLLKTKSVNEFLYDEKKLGIAAKKGFGKTFLLKVKRDYMQGKRGVICIPANSMVDVICTPKFDNSVEKYFENYTNWVYLWQASIAFSIINLISQRENYDFINLIKSKSILNEEEMQIIIEIIKLNYTRPSEYFSIILTMERRKVNIIFKNIGLIVNLLKNIHVSICVFIDKIDQAFATQVKYIAGQTKMSTGPRNASFWQYAQLALMEASYTFISINTHIKIYFSIREEALVDAEKISDVFINLKQYFINISYSENDLKKMVAQYINNEDDDNLVFPELKVTNPIKAFLGIEKINSKYVRGVKENALNYILRHTFMRPRDIMDICYYLYLENLKDLGNNKSDVIRSVVNRESMIIFETLLSETESTYMSITRLHLRKLYELIGHNIIRDDEIKNICYQFNEAMQLGIDDDVKIFECNRNCALCNGLHPFCYLYRIGLIGVLWESRNFNHSIRFPILSDIVIGSADHALPASKLYFLHPCFASRAEHVRKENNKTFLFDTNIVVGNGQRISEAKFDAINIRLNKHYNLNNEPTVFISSTCYDLHDQRAAIDEMLSSMGFYVIRSDGEKFNASLNGVNSHDHCINEMLKCKYLIFIIGKRYGGEYAGKDYEKYANEIRNIDPQLEKPSISLMEYYIASKRGIETFVFVDSDVYNERLTYKTNLRNNITISPAHAGDIRIFHIIDLVTKRNTNNWLREYMDLQNLKEFIRIDFESKKPNHSSN